MDDQNKTDIEASTQETELNTKGSIRTYERDAAEALRQKNSSIGSVFLAEQKKKIESNELVIENPNTHSGLYFLLGVILIFLAGGASYAAYLYINRDTAPALQQKNYSSAVISDKLIMVQTEDVPRNEIIKEIVTSKEEIREKSGTFTSFIFVRGESELQEELGIEKFLERVGWRIPGRLARSLDNVYALGLYSEEDKNESYLVFTINSYEQAFAGMLEWEKVLIDDLSPIFDPKKEVVVETSNQPLSTTTAEKKMSTSTATSTPPVLVDQPLIYVDSVIRNKDVRILKRGEEVILIYAFPDRRTLVIVDDETTLKEVITRLSPDRFKSPLNP
jgi:hypothetical protein